MRKHWRSQEGQAGPAPTWTPNGKIISCKWKMLFNGRTWSCCRAKSPERCGSNIGFGRPRARYTRVDSAIHGRTGRGEVWIIRTCLCLTMLKIFFHIFQRDPGRDLEENTIYLLVFRGDTCKRTKITRAPWRNMNIENTGCRETPWRLGSSARFGYSIDTELSLDKQDSTRYDEKFAAIPYSRKEAWSDSH